MAFVLCTVAVNVGFLSRATWPGVGVVESSGQVSGTDRAKKHLSRLHSSAAQRYSTQRTMHTAPCK